MKPVHIHASILSADLAYLAQDCQKAIDAGIDEIHFDVMDHHYVPNLSFGAGTCQSLRKAGFSLPIDVHLMVDNPDVYIRPFAQAKANCITFHANTSQNVHETIRKIRHYNMQVGLAINPKEPADLIYHLIALVDRLLVMSVHPGFSGQAFIPESLDKIQALRTQLNSLDSQVMLGVDGGIKAQNALAIVDAGADFLVMGSGLFGKGASLPHL